MTCAVTWVPKASWNESSDKRTINLFTNWTPPAGFEFKAFYDYADGNGGLAIVEAATAEAIFEALAPWGAFFTFEVRPIIASEKAVPLIQKAIAWRDSIR
jgi:hypothetical protein